jgi:hypothetical protein
MNESIESKMFNFFVVLPVSEKVRNSWLLPAWTQVRGVSRDAEALRAIRALNLNILALNLFRPDLIRGFLNS